MGDDHWPRHARQWALVGPPLRPSLEDVALAETAVSSVAGGRALVLGVTPELVGMRWPATTTHVLAVERARAVISSIHAAQHTATAIHGDWLALPCANASLAAIVGDGSLSNLRFPDQYRALAAELARVRAPGGVIALRLFAAPERRESLAAVADDLRGGRVGNINVLKWRLAMAVQPDERNVAVVDILRAFDEVVPDRAALSQQLGWSRAHLDSVDVYRGSALTYSFPTVAEVCESLAPRLARRTVQTPGYELGDRCPTLVLG